MPGVASPARARQNVVYCELTAGQAHIPLPIAGAQATEDTAIVIALEDRLFAPGDPMPGNLNIPAQTDHGGQVEDAGHAANRQELIGCRFDPLTQQE